MDIIAMDTKDANNVPSSSPPFESGFVKKSPKVAPNGRVKINAIQNNIMWLSLEQQCNSTTINITSPVTIAPDKYDKPTLSLKKSPKAVPKLFEKRIAIQ